MCPCIIHNHGAQVIFVDIYFDIKIIGNCAVFTVDPSPYIHGSTKYPTTKANYVWNAQVISQGYNTTYPLDGEYVDSFLSHQDSVDYRR